MEAFLILFVFASLVFSVVSWEVASKARKESSELRLFIEELQSNQFSMVCRLADIEYPKHRVNSFAQGERGVAYRRKCDMH